MTESPHFDSPNACADATDRRAARQSNQDWETYARSHRRRKHKQVRCAHCKRWRFPDDRCNFFETAEEAAEASFADTSKGDPT